MQSVNDTLIPNGAASLGANWASEPLLVEGIGLLGIHLVFTGSPVGSFKLQCSGERYNKANPPTNWTDIDGSVVSVTEAGDITWNFEGVGFNWLRVIYTRTSGSGSLDLAQYNGKGV